MLYYSALQDAMLRRIMVCDTAWQDAMLYRVMIFGIVSHHNIIS